MMEECIKIAKKAGIKQFQLQVLKQDKGPIQIDRKCGFREEKKEMQQSIFIKKYCKI